MKKIQADYTAPTGPNDEFEIYQFSTSADLVEETGNRFFLNKNENDFLNNNLNNILLSEMIVDNFTTDNSKKIASASTVKRLHDLSGGLKFVVSDTEPRPQSGVTIVWIDTRESGN